MAEAGPSSGNGSPPAGNPAASRTNHLQFFDTFEQNASQAHAERLDSLSRMKSLGLGHPSSPRRVSASGSSHAGSLSRRRVQSIEEQPQAGPSRLRTMFDAESEPHRRVASLARRGSARPRGSLSPGGSTDASTDYSSAAFSEEYDLSHEDPRILEDVQRALHLKARREARLRALNTKPQSADPSIVSDHASNSSYSLQSSPVRAKQAELPQASAPPIKVPSIESEIDFSPSVGAIPLHPVPSSSNGGATLDWTASSDDERDKRWPVLGMTKRRRDKSSYYNNKAVVEKQESLYVDKLAQIKAKVKPHTLRKATITADQLRRRYAALLDPERPVNLLSAARWYSKQDQVMRTALDSAEPLAWLKHLLDKRGARLSHRLPWHLTALIIDEYAKAMASPLQSIPEDSVMADGVAPVTSPAAPSGLSSESKSPSKSPSSGSWSFPAPQALEPSLSRKRADTDPYDGAISFEPQIDSGRSSAGDDSRRSSLDLLNARRQSVMYGMTDSARSSISGGVYGISPPSSRMNFRDFATRIRRKPYTKSDDGVSSARNSISELSPEDEMSPLKSKSRKRTRPSSLRSPVQGDGTASEREHTAGTHSLSDRGHDSGVDGPSTARPNIASPFFSPEHGTAGNGQLEGTPSRPRTPMRRPNAKRIRRTSLPSLNQLLLHEQEKLQLQADEDEERREYERKSQMLEDAVEQNRRTRQILQRVAANIREYDNVQSGLATLVGKPYIAIPQDILDSLSHDPASITGSTRRFKTWLAVEDIHDRINRQREILHAFIASTSQSIEEPIGPNVFLDSITTLSESLNQLEEKRRQIAYEAERVTETLAEVKEIHAGVKKEYNDVLGHTSLIYPQISQIVALEENYRNKYQQIWDIGLDALTIFLDNVAPLWRTYGKVIGDDLQDFLIVPWYRNEFTGESKRYPIKHFPSRTFRHWIGLLVFIVVSIAVAILQLLAAVHLSLNFNLPWIADTGFRWLLIPFFTTAVFSLWIAFCFEFCIVLAEFGVIIWWLGWSVRVFH